MWALTGRWYADRLSPDYRPADVGTLQGHLTAVGLTDPFWSLTS